MNLSDFLSLGFLKTFLDLTSVCGVSAYGFDVYGCVYVCSFARAYMSYKI